MLLSRERPGLKKNAMCLFSRYPLSPQTNFYQPYTINIKYCKCARDGRIPLYLGRNNGLRASSGENDGGTSPKASSGPYCFKFNNLHTSNKNSSSLAIYHAAARWGPKVNNHPYKSPPECHCLLFLTQTSVSRSRRTLQLMGMRLIFVVLLMLRGWRFCLA